MKRLFYTLCVVLTLPVLWPAVAQTRPASEASVVVAYLFNFGKFVQWPAGSFAADDSPILYCIYGRNSLDGAEDILSGKVIQGRPVQLLQRARGASVSDCHFLFIDASEQKYLQPVLKSIRNQPIVTVSGISRFARTGGMIGLNFGENRLRFEINHAKAQEAGLTISSRLLKLSTRVIRKVDSP